MIEAIVLAAGKSERMGRPKALLEYEGATFLAHIRAVLARSSVGLVRVVLGHRPDEITAAVELAPGEVVINRDYERGMISSIQAGIGSVAGLEVEAALVWPVDHPAITAELIDSLIGTWRESDKGIAIPLAGGRRGHPVLFAARLFGELLAAPDEVGARQVVRAHPEEILEVPTDDPGVLADIDTPEEYNQLKGADGEKP